MPTEVSDLRLWGEDIGFVIDQLAEMNSKSGFFKGIMGEKLSFVFPLADGTLLSGEGARDEERMDYLEFIARVTSHIPDNRQVMVRYSKKESLIPSLIA